MTIYTRYLGPTWTIGARIKVWTTWSGDEKVQRTYSYYYGSYPHDVAVAQYLKDLNNLMQEKNILPENVRERLTSGLIENTWYQAETMDGRGYIYTNSPAYRLEDYLKA